MKYLIYASLLSLATSCSTGQTGYYAPVPAAHIHTHHYQPYESAREEVYITVTEQRMILCIEMAVCIEMVEKYRCTRLIDLY